MNSSASFDRGDSTLADDRHVVLLRHLVHLVHLQQRDRLDRRARQSALDVADHRPPRLTSMAMPMMRVDHRQAVRARLDAAARVLLMSVWLGDSLVMMGLLVRLRQALDHLRRHVRVVAESDAAFLDVRAGNVDLDGVDGRVVEAPA